MLKSLWLGNKMKRKLEVLLVDDYDMLFQMINRPEKYIGD